MRMSDTEWLYFWVIILIDKLILRMASESGSKLHYTNTLPSYTAPIGTKMFMFA